MSERAHPTLNFLDGHRRLDNALSETEIERLAKHFPGSQAKHDLKRLGECLRFTATIYLDTLAQRSDTDIEGVYDLQVRRPGLRRAERTAALAKLVQLLQKLLKLLQRPKLCDIPFQPGTYWPQSFEEQLLELTYDSETTIAYSVPGVRVQRALRSYSNTVRDHWAGIDLDTRFRIISKVPIVGKEGQGSFVRLLELVLLASRSALAESRSRRGPDADTAAVQPVGMLFEIWETWSGTRATHTPRGMAGDMQDSGLPHSTFWPIRRGVL